MILLVDSFISRLILVSVSFESPRFFETYCETAASVIPSFSAAFLWVRPWSFIKLLANSFLMSGRIYQTDSSQSILMAIMSTSIIYISYPYKNLTIVKNRGERMNLEKKDNSKIIILSVIVLLVGTSILPLTANISYAQQTQNEPPTVSIIKPEEKGFYIRDLRIFPSMRTRILGFITVKVSASDDTGIKQVEFYVDGELRNTSKAAHSCGSYMWFWNDRTWLQSRHTLKAIAVDLDGSTSEDVCEVTLHNFPFLHPLYPA